MKMFIFHIVTFFGILAISNFHSHIVLTEHAEG